MKKKRQHKTLLELSGLARKHPLFKFLKRNSRKRLDPHGKGAE